MELILRDLESGSEGKLLSLVVYDRDRLVDLAAAEEIPATRARQGDLLFLGKSNGKATQMIITPGRSVHPKLAAGQPDEAKVIDELSRRLAAETGAPGPAAARPNAAGGGTGPRAPFLSLRPRVRPGRPVHRGAGAAHPRPVRPRLVGGQERRGKGDLQPLPAGRGLDHEGGAERPGRDAQDPGGDDPPVAEGVAAVRPGGRPWSAPGWRSGAGRSSPASRR